MQPEEVLRSYWGHSSFRSVQKAVIQSVIKGHDNLLIMATGAGKSLCYQIPPLLTRRPCIIISPLISLMEDQVNALNARLAGHATACFLGSAQTNAQVKRDAWDGKHLFVYMTPELALNSTSEIKSLDSKIEGGLSFIAVDEAHCVSEWGHDFRRDYFRLGELRSVVNCPVLALTATATSQVQLEIAAKLCMRPDARRWVTSFERPNLFFKVVKRTGPDQLIARLMENFKISASEPSIVYCNTVIQVEEISKMLDQEGRFLGRVSSYHGSMGLGERSSSHKRFLNDDSDIMVATLAYGMGIDKKNVRHIYHFGCPASLEAYYQQAGRAGRDNEHATCTLLWTAGDLMTIDRIKDPGLLSEAGRRAHEAGVNAIQGFLSSTRCRHALLANHFSPGALALDGPCKGGCDNCDARKEGQGGAQPQDMISEAKLMLSAIHLMNGRCGMRRSVDLLRGSKVQKIMTNASLMQAKELGTGRLLHGAGSKRSSEWWSGFAGLLVSEGFVSYQSVQVPGGMSFSAPVLTPKGRQLLFSPPSSSSGPPPSLLLTLPASLCEEVKAPRRSSSPPSLARKAAASASNAVAAEGEIKQLLLALKTIRKDIADQNGVVPELFVSDLALRDIATRRPSSPAEMEEVAGLNERARALFGQLFINCIVSFCSTAKFVKAGDGFKWSKPLNKPSSSSLSARFQPCHPVSDALMERAKMMMEEPKGAAMNVNEMYSVKGMTPLMISTERKTQVSTTISYLAQCCASGILKDYERLATDSCLSKAMALCIASEIESDPDASSAAAGDGRRTLGMIKRQVEAKLANETVDWGHLNATLALIIQRQLWFADGLSPSSSQDGDEEEEEEEEEDDFELPESPKKAVPPPPLSTTNRAPLKPLLEGEDVTGGWIVKKPRPTSLGQG